MHPIFLEGYVLTEASDQETEPAPEQTKPKPEGLLKRSMKLGKDLAVPFTFLVAALTAIGTAAAFLFPYFSDPIDKFARQYILRVLAGQDQAQFEESQKDYPDGFLQSDNLLSLVNRSQEIAEMRSLVDTVYTFRVFRLFGEDVSSKLESDTRTLAPEMDGLHKFFLTKGMTITAHFFPQRRKEVDGRDILISSVEDSFLGIRVGLIPPENPIFLSPGSAISLTDAVCRYFENSNTDSGLVPLSFEFKGIPYYAEYSFDVVFVVSKDNGEGDNGTCS